jgi:hypothetical protein
MSNKNQTVMTGFRLSRVDLAILRDLAEARGVPVSHLLYQRVMPWARREWERLDGRSDDR